MTSENQNYRIIKSVNIPNDEGVIRLVNVGQKWYITRKSIRSGIENTVEFYEKISPTGKSVVSKIGEVSGGEILRRIESGEDYTSAFVFYDTEIEDSPYKFSDMEHMYTSTGIKFWRNSSQMFEYKTGGTNTVISTHISPEGGCNLKCPYCSVTYRDTHSRIRLEVIQDYVEKLIGRGLKAVILTGGGEPTLYRHFNELVRWIKNEKKLSVALITNGTNSNKVENDVWGCFSWIRVSINLFDKWEETIKIPIEHVNENCIIGASFVMTVEHQKLSEEYINKAILLKKVSLLADKINSKYVRILPNCLLQGTSLSLVHKNIDLLLSELNDSRFFHQNKYHKAPGCNICHQSYFRPYLSEEPYWKTGKPGSVYPCDSLVLNNSNQRFLQKYQLCAAEDVLDFIDKKIKPEFVPSKDCTGCVFTSTVDMLDRWKLYGEEYFHKYTSPIVHEEFI